MSAPRKPVGTIRERFARLGLDIGSIDEAAVEIDRLIGLLRIEQNARLAAENELRELLAASAAQHGSRE